MCVIMQNFVIIGQMVFRDIAIYFFKMAIVRHLGFLNFWLTIRLGGQICIAVPSFIKISQMAAKISHLTFFKLATIRHLGFFNCFFNISI